MLKHVKFIDTAYPGKINFRGDAIDTSHIGVMSLASIVIISGFVRCLLMLGIVYITAGNMENASKIARELVSEACSLRKYVSSIFGLPMEGKSLKKTMIAMFVKPILHVLKRSQSL